MRQAATSICSATPFMSSWCREGRISYGGKKRTGAVSKAGDQAKLADAQKRWTENADEIAAFLTAANPKAWPAGTQTRMREHLALTTKEAVARLTGRWGQDVAAYDAVYKQILHMADMLSAGIVAQFPQRFR